MNGEPKVRVEADVPAPETGPLEATIKSVEQHAAVAHRLYSALATIDLRDGPWGEGTAAINQLNAMRMRADVLRGKSMTQIRGEGYTESDLEKMKADIIEAVQKALTLLQQNETLRAGISKVTLDEATALVGS